MLGNEVVVFAKKRRCSDTLIFGDWMAEENPWQKWSIWYLWEHLLVPEHRTPIWVGFKLGFCVEDIVEDMKMLIFH